MHVTTAMIHEPDFPRQEGCQLTLSGLPATSGHGPVAEHPDHAIRRGRYSPTSCSSSRSSLENAMQPRLDDDDNDAASPTAEPESHEAGTASAQSDRLSIENPAHDGDVTFHMPARRGRGLPTPFKTALKRAASTGPSSPKSASVTGPHVQPGRPVHTCHPSAKRTIARLHNPRAVSSTPNYCAVSSGNNFKALRRVRQDSGSETAPSRTNTMEPNLPQGDVVHASDVRQPATHTRYPGLILQPDSCPISPDQLATEVKGIYAGLVMVEAKCIAMDELQAKDPKSPLSPEAWQALIALHRTLLYEHHDFLMATQHPSATAALRGLATKYSMPARMWKHGIHAFLEVLRHRRPDSQEYMLAFIYLAYQMMALLLETVPSFTDTWIECLGDLARYRMAIEEEKDAHATWGGVAARWYSIASDRHPAIGRLYHHLGILERPSLRKFCLYAKSLTSTMPFPNARDSLSTLCVPIVQNEHTIESSKKSAEARAVTFHALVYSGADFDTTKVIGRDTCRLLQRQIGKLRDIGAYLAITNIAAMFELGSTTNLLWQLYAAAVESAVQNIRPSMTSTSGPAYDLEQLHRAMEGFVPNPLLSLSIDFFFSSFDTIMTSYDAHTTHGDCLGYVHVVLVWFHSLYALRGRLNEHSQHTFGFLIDWRRVQWSGLAKYLNCLVHKEQELISAQLLEAARQGLFPAPEGKDDARPLSEDYFIRGLIFGQFYFNPNWFDGQSEDDGRAIETDDTYQARAQRVLWLGLYLAFNTEHLAYDVQKKTFTPGSLYEFPTLPSVPAVDGAMDMLVSASPHRPQTLNPPVTSSAETIGGHSLKAGVPDSPTSRSICSTKHSSSSEASDDFVHVKRHKSTAPARHVPPPAKRGADTKRHMKAGTMGRHMMGEAKVFDDDEITEDGELRGGRY